MRTALPAALALWLGAAAGITGAQPLTVEPPSLQDHGPAVTIEVRRSDGRAFCAGADCLPWVGAAFGRLIRVPTSATPAGEPTMLHARLARLAALWRPSPAAGEAVVLVVYLGDQPISAPFALPVRVAGEGQTATDDDTEKVDPR